MVREVGLRSKETNQRKRYNLARLNAILSLGTAATRHILFQISTGLRSINNPIAFDARLNVESGAANTRFRGGRLGLGSEASEASKASKARGLRDSIFVHSTAFIAVHSPPLIGARW